MFLGNLRVFGRFSKFKRSTARRSLIRDSTTLWIFRFRRNTLNILDDEPIKKITNQIMTKNEKNDEWLFPITSTPAFISIIHISRKKTSSKMHPRHRPARFDILSIVTSIAVSILATPTNGFLLARGAAGAAFTTNTVRLTRIGGPLNGAENEEDDDLENNIDFPSLMPPGIDKMAGLPGMSPPDKSSLYSDTELMDLLQIHEGLSEIVVKPPQPSEKESILLPGEQASDGPSLHDMVLQALAAEDDFDSSSSSAINYGGENAESILLPGEKSVDGPSLHEMVLQALEEEETISDKNLEDLLEKKTADIIAIASDVDGTLLTSKHELHPRTEAAIRLAVQLVQSAPSSSPNSNKLQYFFPATGKTRKGALDSLGPEMRKLLSNLPGVFIQGLYCVDGDEQVVFEQRLSSSAIEKAEELCKTDGLVLLGYDGDTLYSNKDSDFAREIHTKWGEPMPKYLSSNFHEHPNGFHKLLVMDPNTDKLSMEVRPKLQALADSNQASVTQAIPSMLELLPEGCSKALGVEKLCAALGIDPTRELLAIGDAENDVEMLKLAAIGVAVNNACAMAIEAADVTMLESNDEGGAGAAMERFSPIRHHI